MTLWASLCWQGDFFQGSLTQELLFFYKSFLCCCIPISGNTSCPVCSQEQWTWAAQRPAEIYSALGWASWATTGRLQSWQRLCCQWLASSLKSQEIMKNRLWTSKWHIHIFWSALQNPDIFSHIYIHLLLQKTERQREKQQIITFQKLEAENVLQFFLHYFYTLIN